MNRLAGSRCPTLLRVVPILVVAAALVAPAAASAQAPATGSPAVDRALKRIPPNDLERDDGGDGQARPVPSDKLPDPPDSPLAAANPGFAGFDALRAFDQFTADDGNTFSLEPPDQGLCVGGGEVVEPVNTVIATYDANGNRLSGPTSLTPFFTGQHQVTFDPDGNPTSFGPFLSDPKCYFDPDQQRFYMTILEIDTDPVTGDFGDHSSVLIAVSRTSTPSTDPAGWFFYKIDTTNDGTNGTPAHANCPCLGDQPLIGADRFGFYVTTNEFPLDLSNDAFNGAQVYAIDKAAAAAGTLKVQRIEGEPIPLEEGPAASLQPATSPTVADWATTNGGTEYLLSSLDFDSTIDHRIATWALTNTSSLATATPDVKLSHVTLQSEVYAFPPDARQKKGPTPLRDLLNEQNEKGPKLKLEKLAGNDDRMNQVVFAGGHLFSGLNTAVHGKRVGIAWFVVDPSFPEGGELGATIARQGYVAVRNASALYPSIAVNAAGQGVMTFTISGKDLFPSAAYTPFTAASGSGPVHIAGAGTEPIDGFVGYLFDIGVSRWGDYSAAVPAADGSLWIATEYVPGGPRDPIENWGTFVGRLVP